MKIAGKDPCSQRYWLPAACLLAGVLAVLALRKGPARERHEASAIAEAAAPKPRTSWSLAQPRASHPPSGVPSASAAPVDPTSPFPETATGRRLSAHWQVATTPRATIAEAEAAHSASLAQLRGHEAEAAELLQEAYWKANEHHYESRFVLASALSDLSSDEAYEPLREIAMEAIPPEREAHSHSESTQMQERMIRMVAVDGLADLAKSGNADAERDLLEIASNAASDAQRGSRVRAIKGYLAAGPDTEARAELLRARTPEELHWAITLKVPTREEIYAHIPPGESQR